MKFKLFSWKVFARGLSIILCFYCLFSFWMACWFYRQTDWKALEEESEDFMFRQACIAVIFVDILLFLWSFVGIFASFRNHNKKTTIYFVFLIVLLMHKTLYGAVFYTGGTSTGYNFQENMRKRWENCCGEEENYYELAIWRVSNINEIVSLVLMSVVGSIGSFCLYQVSIS